jgi:biopolymer transport protein ExbB
MKAINFNSSLGDVVMSNNPVGRKMSYKLLSSCLLALVLASPFVGSTSAFANEKLEGLLKKIQDEKSLESELWKEREKEFEVSKAEQQNLLNKANRELNALQNESLRLGKVFDQNEKELQTLEEKKNQVMGAFGELYGTLRQSAGDFNTLILNSATSAENNDRFKAIQQLAQTKRLPEYSELENFWYLLQQEMTLQSQTSNFKSKVMNEKGIKEEKEVTRVGAFNNFVGNKYLSFDTKSKSLQVYPRQPERAFTKHLDDFSGTAAGSMALVSIDPSKGALLETLIQAPTLMERFHQGGLVGYVIFALLIVGFALAIERLYYYAQQERQMKLQLKNMNEPIPGNPLASLISVFQKYKTETESDVLSLKLSEVVLHEKPKLERGLSTIKTFAGVAPLLGLLGTVTGMILTFQSITMFGSGDPKLMAGGISQALITTVLGLVCAIPLLVIYNHVNTKYQRILIFLNEQLAGMMAEVEMKKTKEQD